MSATAWFRFFPSDWLGGTRGLTDRQTGVYISLIAMMYDHREPLRDDAEWLARMCGSPNAASFRKVLQTLLDEGKIIRTDVGLWNERVQGEIEVFNKNSNSQKQKAHSRWSKKPKQNKASTMPVHSSGIAADMPYQKPEPEPYKSSSLRSDDSAAKAAPTAKTELASVLDDTHVKAVIDHRSKIRKPLTAHAAHLLAGKFAQCADPNAAADAMVANGWQGFEPDWLATRSTARAPPPQQQQSMLDYLKEETRRLKDEEDARTIEGDYRHGHHNSPN